MHLISKVTIVNDGIYRQVSMLLEPPKTFGKPSKHILNKVCRLLNPKGCISKGPALGTGTRSRLSTHLIPYTTSVTLLGSHMLPLPVQVPQPPSRTSQPSRSHLLPNADMFSSRLPHPLCFPGPFRTQLHSLAGLINQAPLTHCSLPASLINQTVCAV